MVTAETGGFRLKKLFQLAKDAENVRMLSHSALDHNNSGADGAFASLDLCAQKPNFIKFAEKRVGVTPDPQHRTPNHADM
jgi:hypothetical protein